MMPFFLRMVKNTPPPDEKGGVGGGDV
jgi:hypothetical protein